MIDTHAHIDDPQYREEFDEYIRRQQDGGVERIVVPGISAASIEPVRAVCLRYPDYLVAGIGLHPEEVKDDWREQLDVLYRELSTHADFYKAIGEIGLDYYWDKTYKAEQQEVLRIQLGWARERDLPVLIHNREATEDTVRILREAQTEHGQGGSEKALRGVFHCFSGSRETARQILDMGFYLGIGGVLTFKNSKLKEVLAGVPPERLVLETDSPYMAPVPYRGQRNESRYMSEVVKMLADIYKVSPEAVNEVTTRSAKALFRLK